VAKSKTPAKRARRAEKNRLNNMAKKSQMKTAIKKFDAALAEKNLELAKERLVAATSVIDKNAANGIIHKNAAARKKSQLMRNLNTATATA
jgi:small subunit ribosomal protein S20